jgi:pimeloyl-ACP methyl ester carboxylesterase
MSESEHIPEDSVRSVELRVAKNGAWHAGWSLTTTQFIQPVRINFPPVHVLPIIFVPGIMGSNLCDLSGNPVWLLNGIHDVPVRLAKDWSRKTAAHRQAVLHPDKTTVFAGGAVPKHTVPGGLSTEDYVKRGWGEVSQSSYHKFLLWLDDKLNLERDPARWVDFTYSTIGSAAEPTKQSSLSPGLMMQMTGLPEVGDNSSEVEPLRSDELLRRAKFTFPIYAFGYNWLASNIDAAKLLKARVERVIAENNRGPTTCKQVILVTHSMGGLVARACSLLPDMTEKILGVIHGVMPSTGAAVAYRRCKVGMRDEDYAAGLVIGADGPKVAAVFAQSPGALQLLPSKDYGPNWLRFEDPSGSILKALPHADPYEEIYLVRDKWWGLIREEWLRPSGHSGLRWDKYVANIRSAKDFHTRISGKFHPYTYVLYGGGAEVNSFAKINWKLNRGFRSFDNSAPTVSGVLELGHTAIKTDGSNHLSIGAREQVETTSHGDVPVAISREASFWEISCKGQDSAGDGTVPIGSGSDPSRKAGREIIQQFPLQAVQHESVYRNSSTARTIVLYAITKLAAKAEVV